MIRNMGRRTRRRLLAATGVLSLAVGMLIASTPAEAATPRPAGAVYRSSADGLLREVGPNGEPLMVANGLGVAPGTQPTAAEWSGGGRIIAFHAWGTDELWYVDTDNIGHNTGYKMPPGASPAVVAWTGGNFRIAFVNAADGLLWELTTNGTFFFAGAGYGVAPGTSPAIANIPGAGLMIAFQAVGGRLWYVDVNNVGHETAARVAPGTSPAITGWSGGNYRVAFVNAADGLLWELTTDGTLFFGGAGFGVATGTSPSIAAATDVGLVIAFQAAGGHLWYIGPDNVGHDTGLQMASGTSPAVAGGISRSYQIVFQDDTHTLVKYQNGGDVVIDTHLNVSPDTSPGLAAGSLGALTYPSDPVIPAPRLESVSVSGTSVTVTWTDRSTFEDTFAVRRRNATSVPRKLTEVATRNRTGLGDTYTFTDTITAGARVCYEISVTNGTGAANYSNEICTRTPALPSPPATGESIISTVDSSAAVGEMSSAAIGSDGLAVVSYWKADTKDLRVGHCTNVDCTALTVHDIDTVGDVGYASSLEIGSDGLPLISYVSRFGASGNATQDLEVAHCADVACASATITTVDSVAAVNPDETALAIGPDGLGIIAYATKGPSLVKVAHCLNVTCSRVKVRVIDGFSHSINSGNDTVSVAVSPTGAVYVAHPDQAGGGYLSMTTCTDPECAVIAAQTSVDLDRAGQSASITIGLDGLPLISYTANLVPGSSDLAVGHCVNVYCTALTRTTVHTGASTGWYGHIAIGADGLGVVAYTDLTNRNVEVAHCADLTCTSLSRSLVDEFDDQGSSADSIAIGADGLPLISYLSRPDNLLRVAHCGDAACTGPFTAPF